MPGLYIRRGPPTHPGHQETRRGACAGPRGVPQDHTSSFPTFIAAYGALTGKLGGFTADLISFASPARVLAWALNTDSFAPPPARDVANTAH